VGLEWLTRDFHENIKYTVYSIACEVYKIGTDYFRWMVNENPLLNNQVADILKKKGSFEKQNVRKILLMEKKIQNEHVKLINRKEQQERQK
jgi:CRP-like cAMP-binding protein